MSNSFYKETLFFSLLLCMPLSAHATNSCNFMNQSSLSANSSLLNVNTNSSYKSNTELPVINSSLLKHLTEVASTTVNNFKQTGNANIDTTLVKPALTASHRSLPIDTKINIINQNNGKNITVSISKRLTEGNNNTIIALSHDAATEIDITEKGIAQVTIERVH